MKKIREHILLALISWLLGLILWGIFCRQWEILENQEQSLKNDSIMLNGLKSLDEKLNNIEIEIEYED